MGPKSEPTPSSIPRPRPPRELEDPPAPKRPRPIVSAPVQSYNQDDDDIQEVLPVVKQEPPTVVADPLPTPPQPMAAMSQVYQQQPDHSMHQTNTVAQIDDSYGDDGYDYGGYGEEDPYEGAMMESGAGGDQNKGPSDYILESPAGKEFICQKCGKVFSD